VQGHAVDDPLGRAQARFDGVAHGRTAARPVAAPTAADCFECPLNVRDERRNPTFAEVFSHFLCQTLVSAYWFTSSVVEVARWSHATSTDRSVADPH
jgi:hypothetical protein